MRNLITRATYLAVGVLSLGAMAAFGPAASASAFHPPANGQTIDIGPSPTGVGNCTFANNDASFLLESANAVFHDTSNANGDWGGGTVEGTVLFQEAPYNGFDQYGNPVDTGAPVPLYEGHLAYWTGGGNNAGGQTEGGFTLTFRGSALGGGGTLDIHATGHSTTNNAGITTNSFAVVNVSCS